MRFKKFTQRIKTALFVLKTNLFYKGNLKCSKSVVLGKRIEIKPALNSLVRISGNSIISNDCVLESFGGGKIIIEDNVFINCRTQIVAKDSIIIGKGTKIGPNVLVYDHDHDIVNKPGYISSPISIGENVWIGAGAIILKGVTIGNNSVIAAGAIVTSNIDENTIYMNKLSSVNKKINSNVLNS